MSEQDERLRELGHELPWDRPDPARRDGVRSALLVAAAERDTRPSTRWYVVGGAFAAGALAAAAAVLLFVGGDERPAPQTAARIEASPAAQVERKVTRTPTGLDEVVRVRSGSLSVAVDALRAGDHVRVATRDAEVEGDGAYHVIVVGDMLQEVNVTNGTATVRVGGQRAQFLSTGETWTATPIVAREDIKAGPAAVAPLPPDPVAPVPPAPVVVEPQPSAIPAPKLIAKKPIAEPAAASIVEQPESAQVVEQAESAQVVEQPESARVVKQPDPAPASAASAPAAAPAIVDSEVPPSPTKSGPTEVERRFQAGMSLLKANKHAEAARELLAAADTGGDDPLAADARYFAAVAMTKAGRKTEAERALVGFIDRAPTSIRRGRAAVMLARLIAERGDSTSARAWFESALGDADASVVAAARAGIAALH